jgi:hypothetical protein
MKIKTKTGLLVATDRRLMTRQRGAGRRLGRVPLKLNQRSTNPNAKYKRAVWKHLLFCVRDKLARLFTLGVSSLDPTPNAAWTAFCGHLNK